AELALHRILDVRRRLLHRILHFAQFLELDLAVDVGLDVGDIALQPAGENTKGARDARQALRPDHDQRDQADDQHFGETDVEHGVLRLAGAKTVRFKTKRAPSGRPSWDQAGTGSGLALGPAFYLALDRLAGHLRRGSRVGSLV